MRQVAVLMILLLLAISIGTAQDNAAVEQTATEQPDAPADAAADDASPASPLEALDWMVGTWVDEGDGAGTGQKTSMPDWFKPGASQLPSTRPRQGFQP